MPRPDACPCRQAAVQLSPTATMALLCAEVHNGALRSATLANPRAAAAAAMLPSCLARKLMFLPTQVAVPGTPGVSRHALGEGGPPRRTPTPRRHRPCRQSRPRGRWCHRRTARRRRLAPRAEPHPCPPVCSPPEAVSCELDEMKTQKAHVCLEFPCARSSASRESPLVTLWLAYIALVDRNDCSAVLAASSNSASNFVLTPRRPWATCLAQPTY